MEHVYINPLNLIDGYKDYLIDMCVIIHGKARTTHVAHAKRKRHPRRNSDYKTNINQTNKHKAIFKSSYFIDGGESVCACACVRV